jgi:hypothetical protein
MLSNVEEILVVSIEYYTVALEDANYLEYILLGIREQSTSSFQPLNISC